MGLAVAIQMDPIDSINIDADSTEPLLSAVRHFIRALVFEQKAGIAQCLSHGNAESARQMAIAGASVSECLCIAPLSGR